MADKKAKLILEDGTIFEGKPFGAQRSTAGEVVFATGMVGYEQSLTDPSYAGQILTFTYPLIGNWGVPPKNYWESSRIQVAGLIISDLTTHPNHHLSQRTLDAWLKSENIPGIYDIDTRKLTQKLREKGVMLGKIIYGNQDIPFWDPNAENLVSKVSPREVIIHRPEWEVRNENVENEVGSGKNLTSHIKNPASHLSHHTSLNIALLNCGAKRNILRNLLRRGATVYDLPWNSDLFNDWHQDDSQAANQKHDGVSSKIINKHQKTSGADGGMSETDIAKRANLKVSRAFFDSGETGTRDLETTDRTRPRLPKIDGLVISNGPGDPKMARESIEIIKKALKHKIPTFGICLGNQLLALAAGGDTYKLKFGHRAQNQPTIEVGSKRCYITTQNHGFAVSEKKLPDGFKRWFYNANDNTNEGIIHEKLPFFSVQFHPEATPGPYDTEFLFDFFMEKFK